MHFEIAFEVWQEYSHIETMQKHLAKSENLATTTFCLHCIQEAWKTANKLEKKFARFCNNQAGDVIDAMIEKAKAYPIADLLPPTKGNHHCISHSDKMPSMSIKNNYAYCFACGFKGDAIDVYMKLNSCDFITAVKNLQ